MLKRWSVIWLLTVVFIFNSCIDRGQEENKSSVRVATLKGPSAISMIHMIDSLKQIDHSAVRFQIFHEPMQLRPLLIREKVAFAVVPTNMASILYNKGMNYKLAAVPVWGTLYLFGESKDIQSWTDLKGKRIHVMAKGMTPDVMFRFLLDKHGIDPQMDVKLDYSFPTHIELANAVASGKARLGVISEPLVSMVISRSKQVKPIFSLNEEWHKITGMDIPQTALLVHQDFARNNKKVVDHFLETYNGAVQWVNAHPHKGASLIVRYDILHNKEVAYQAIPRCNMKFMYGHEIRNQVLDFLEIFYRMNPDIVGGQLPNADFFYKK